MHGDVLMDVKSLHQFYKWVLEAPTPITHAGCIISKGCTSDLDNCKESSCPFNRGNSCERMKLMDILHKMIVSQMQQFTPSEQEQWKRLVDPNYELNYLRVQVEELQKEIQFLRGSYESR
jgi:hypothetical protein